MKIFISCDHAAIDLKNEICEYVNSKDGYEAVNLGIEHGEKHNAHVGKHGERKR